MYIAKLKELIGKGTPKDWTVFPTSIKGVYFQFMPKSEKYEASYKAFIGSRNPKGKRVYLNEENFQPIMDNANKIMALIKDLKQL